MKKGFTLIELLVVVLIIGILAAVALPKYEQAVAKTRYMSLLPLARSISDAENVYYMANGTYTTDFSQLDIDVPQDISVVGFDGTSASREEDGLTTISLPFYAIGRRAVHSLLDYYENGISDSNRLSYLQTFLVSKKTLSYAKNENLYHNGG